MKIPRKKKGNEDPAESNSFYRLKRVRYGDRSSVPVCLQNKNGPCPLLAIANALLLRNEIEIHPDFSFISEEQLIEKLTEFLYAENKRHVANMKAAGKCTDEYLINNQANIAEVIKLLPKLKRGIDVNVKYGPRPDSFEYTGEVACFDLFRTRLVHGWLVDPQDAETYQALGEKSFNQVMDTLIVADINSSNGASANGSNSSAIRKKSSTSKDVDKTSSQEAASSTVEVKLDVAASGGSEPSNIPVIDAADLSASPVKQDNSIGEDTMGLVSAGDAKEVQNGAQKVSEEEVSAKLVDVSPESAKAASNDDFSKSSKAQTDPLKIVREGNVEEKQVEEVSANDASTNEMSKASDLANSFCDEESDENVPSSQEPSDDLVTPSDKAMAAKEEDRDEAVDAQMEELNSSINTLTTSDDAEHGSAVETGHSQVPQQEEAAKTAEKEKFASISENSSLPRENSGNDRSGEANGPDERSNSAKLESETDIAKVKDLVDHESSNSEPSKAGNQCFPANDKDKEDLIKDEDTKSVTNQKAAIEEAPYIQEFLRAYPSQLTYYGLAQLHDFIRPGELCVLFRNNHFSTVTRHQNELYLLVSDLGYLHESDIVWEKLNDLSGNTGFVSGNFRPFHAHIPGGSVVKKDGNNDQLAAQATRKANEASAQAMAPTPSAPPLDGSHFESDAEYATYLARLDAENADASYARRLLEQERKSNNAHMSADAQLAQKLQDEERRRTIQAQNQRRAANSSIEQGRDRGPARSSRTRHFRNDGGARRSSARQRTSHNSECVIQ